MTSFRVRGRSAKLLLAALGSNLSLLACASGDDGNSPVGGVSVEPTVAVPGGASSSTGPVLSSAPTSTQGTPSPPAPASSPAPVGEGGESSGGEPGEPEVPPAPTLPSQGGAGGTAPEPDVSAEGGSSAGGVGLVDCVASPDDASCVGGAGGSGGAQGGAGGEDPGPAPTPGPGQIGIDDPVPGFASVSGGTTGGGTDLASAITVSTMSELSDAASGNEPAIILVEPGDYDGTLRPGANKTIIGIEPGVKINGNVSISGEDTSNVIIRNIAVQGGRCNSYDECRAGSDAVYVGNGAHHVWLDHLDISDGQDGNCDVTQAADFVTVSWTHFHYTYDKEHRFSNLIAGGDDEVQSRGKLKITYMNNHWGERVDSRQPRGRFGDVHMLNNYHDTGGSQIHGVGFEMALIAENSVYEENGSIWTDMGSPRGWRGIGNIGSASGLNESRGTVFEIPYDYTALPAEAVVDAVMASECGAGNTCVLAR